MLRRLADLLFGQPSNKPPGRSDNDLRAVVTRLISEGGKGRLHAFLIALLGFSAAGILPFAAVTGVRESLPLPAGALLSWPTFSPPGVMIVMVAFLGALPLATFAAVRGEAWPLIKWPCLALLVAGVAANLAGLDNRVVVYADRAVIHVGLPARTHTLRFAEAEAVVADCDIIGRRRREDIAGIAYAVRFPSGRMLELADAPRRGSRSGMRDWFARVERLDRAAFARLPHGNARPHTPGCIRLLRNQFDDEAFTAAARIIGLSPADYAVTYAAPHVAWRGPPRDADDVRYPE